MTRVAIFGASGYTGLELLRILARHPEANVTTLVTRQDDRPHVVEIHPSLAGQFDLSLDRLSPEQVAERADCAFTCLPHGASAEMVKTLLARGLKVVDLSADYRLTDRAVYEQWYGVEHPDSERLGAVPYGLPELYRERIRGASVVANPGCYPTSALLALAPLLKTGHLEREGLVIDSKSGVSGAGRNPKPNLHFPECNDNFSAYGVGTHRHMPEIDQVLSDVAKVPLEVVFTPHLVPMDRGILSTCYATPTENVSSDCLIAALRDFYDREPFVDVVEGLPTTKDVARTNRCCLTARVVRGRVVMVSVIDNLVKGAAGAAVQNFNLIYGYEETTALV